MLGNDERMQEGMFSYVALEDRIPAIHSLRKVSKVTDLVGKRPAVLSITHKSSTDEDAKFDVIESRHTAPHDRVSRWGIFGPGQVASQPGNFGEIGTKRCRLALVACAVRYQTIKHAGFKLR